MADMEQSATDEQRKAGERLLDAIASNPALAANLPWLWRRGDGSSHGIASCPLRIALGSPRSVAVGRPPDFAFDIGVDRSCQRRRNTAAGHGKTTERRPIPWPISPISASRPGLHVPDA